MKKAIGVDLGGTNTKVGLVSYDGRILKRIEVPTRVDKGSHHLINNIIECIKKIHEKNIEGIGVGSPGPLDSKKGIILDPVNLPLRNVPIKKILEKEFKTTVILNNDANCYALGEAHYGAAKRYRHVVGLTLGTGIGGGIIIDKKLYHGRGNAAELGHMTIDFNGKESNCGNNGCIEELAAARGILSRSKGMNVETTLQLFQLARKGNRKAQKVFHDIGEFLGVAITNTMYAFDPEIIVIGGKISESWQFFEESMHETIRKRYFSRPCPVVRTKLGRDAGILGAASLLLDQ